MHFVRKLIPPETQFHAYVLHKSVVSIAHNPNIICNKTQSEGTMYEQTILCMQNSFAYHIVGSSPMKRKEKMHQTIMNINGK